MPPIEKIDRNHSPSSLWSQGVYGYPIEIQAFFFTALRCALLMLKPNIYRFKTEEYSHTAVNKFNVNPESIPVRLFDFMSARGGYFVGNVSPARMDFRWFALGNCIAILVSLATPDKADAIMDLVEERWEGLIKEMPVKTYPTIEGHEWQVC
jgi:hypothetical protein